MKLIVVLLSTILYFGAVPCLALLVAVGQWDFNDPANLTKATIGNNLVLTGTHTPVIGPPNDAGAVRIGTGSYYTVTHNIAPNGGGRLVNEYTLVMDVRINSTGQWHSLFQTNPANVDDCDCCINPSGQVGIAQTGYSSVTVQASQWYRLTVVVKNGQRYEIYLNGNLILNGRPQVVDGRFALKPTLLLFADDNGEDHDIDVARVTLYSSALTAAEVESLGKILPASGEQPLTGPYLQNVKTNGITIMWETVAYDSGWVEYGTDVTYGSTQSGTGSASGGGTWVYKAILSGLQPGTQYHFRVVTDSTATPDSTFTTAPADRIDFSFSVWGDSQGNNKGQAADPLEPTKSMMRHMTDSSMVSLAVTVGDLAENGNAYSDVKTYFLNRPIQILGKKVPIYVAWGNHDGGGGSIIRNFVDLPSKDRARMNAGFGSYSFDYAGCHFICVDYFEEYQSRSDFLDWLRMDLQSPAAQNARFRFVFIHIPPYCELWIDGEAWQRANIVPLLEQYKVDICFSGHTHEYERGYLNGVYYCVTGGGSWLDINEPLVKDWPHMTVGGYTNISSTVNKGLVNEYVKVEINGNRMTVKMMAFKPDGTFIGILDSFAKESVQLQQPLHK